MTRWSLFLQTLSLLHHFLGLYSRDSVRDATRQEIQALKRENGELKQLVAELSLEAYRLKKRSSLCLRTASVSPDERRGEGDSPFQGDLIASPQA